VVLDEYGTVIGMVTLTDLLKAIIGEIDLSKVAKQSILEGDEFGWLVNGSLPIDQLTDTVPLGQIPAEECGKYNTVAGFFLHQLGRVPEVGDNFQYQSFYFRVTS